jgi:hypothetical protein
MLFLFFVIAFIRENPGVVAWLVGGLFTLILTVVGAYWGLIASRLSKLEEADLSLANRVGEVEVTLGRYEEHVGAGDQLLKKLAERIERHMNEEEDKVWNGIGNLTNQLSQMQKENLEAHAFLTERLVRVETKMPNGQLDKMVQMLQVLTDRR